ncbi:beta-galactosidase [Capsulimonas corticalis]|uniref:Beta-galactosidase n=1 Tax=Capsulimonas corticalis TaxID=2219043 RepID=A0A402CNL7_9BACT|nr:DUF5597 domain-containing protein [Capsulimonas corticalis]BDI33307.1 beta-galactosidase [Capsulimonas corticalis]
MTVARFVGLTLAVTAGVMAGAANARIAPKAAVRAPLGAGVPQLRKQDGVTQLFVDGRPFLMLAGELNNSSSSSLAYMEKIWPQMNAIHANTVLTPISWDLVEPKEGVYDFALVDGLIQGARQHHLHLVFLWLASWKNGMSSYDPLYVKRDTQRFPRAMQRDGTPRDVLSTLGENACAADSHAFAALMAHLREFDAKDHTVVMMQVENEVGILGDSRDRSAAANTAYAGPVPQPLMDHLKKNDQDLNPEFRDLWVKASQKTSGTWEQVFGAGPGTDEIFMAWNYARYVDRVAAAGKAEYPIPMYANAWLNEKGSQPGDYPSGCPESHVMDVWQAGAPHLDMLSPDLYASNFTERADLYTRRGNPLFIPEMNSDAGGAHSIFYAIGAHNALGTSPFGVDRVQSDSPFSKSYDILSRIAPCILAHQTQGEVIGFTIDADHPVVKRTMGGYDLEISFDSALGRSSTSGYGIVIALAPGQFLGAGSGFSVRFRPSSPGAPKYGGIASVTEGSYIDGVWTPNRRLNGDETDQGGRWRFPSWSAGVSQCTAYGYN